MTPMIKKMMGTFGLRTGLGMILAAAALAAVPSPTLAEHHDRDNDGGFRVDVRVPIVVRPEWAPPVTDRETRVWVEPIYRTVEDRQWVEPVYQTVTDRVWVSSTTTTQTDRVWVPDYFEPRDVVRYEHGRRRISREMALIQPAHYEDAPGQVVITPGHYQEVQRQQLVCDGHWQRIERQELVTPGHWESRIEQFTAPPAVDRGGVQFELRWPFR